jgi:hypothetical protein
MAEHGDRSRIRAREPRHDVDQRRLPCAVRAEERKRLATLDRQVDTGESPDGPEGFLDAANLDRGPHQFLLSERSAPSRGNSA